MYIHSQHCLLTTWDVKEHYRWQTEFCKLAFDEIFGDSQSTYTWKSRQHFWSVRRFFGWLQHSTYRDIGHMYNKHTFSVIWFELLWSFCPSCEDGKCIVAREKKKIQYTQTTLVSQYVAFRNTPCHEDGLGETWEGLNGGAYPEEEGDLEFSCGDQLRMVRGVKGQVRLVGVVC